MLRNWYGLGRVIEECFLSDILARLTPEKLSHLSTLHWVPRHGDFLALLGPQCYVCITCSPCLVVKVWGLSGQSRYTLVVSRLYSGTVSVMSLLLSEHDCHFSLMHVHWILVIFSLGREYTFHASDPPYSVLYLHRVGGSSSAYPFENCVIGVATISIPTGVIEPV